MTRPHNEDELSHLEECDIDRFCDDIDSELRKWNNVRVVGVLENQRGIQLFNKFPPGRVGGLARIMAFRLMLQPHFLA
jgi:hypothetical protein